MDSGSSSPVSRTRSRSRWAGDSPGLISFADMLLATNRSFPPTRATRPNQPLPVSIKIAKFCRPSIPAYATSSNMDFFQEDGASWLHQPPGLVYFCTYQIWPLPFRTGALAAILRNRQQQQKRGITDLSLAYAAGLSSAANLYRQMTYQILANFLSTIVVRCQAFP